MGVQLRRRASYEPGSAAEALSEIERRAASAGEQRPDLGLRRADPGLQSEVDADRPEAAAPPEPPAPGRVGATTGRRSINSAPPIVAAGRAQPVSKDDAVQAGATDDAASGIHESRVRDTRRGVAPRRDGPAAGELAAVTSASVSSLPGRPASPRREEVQPPPADDAVSMGSMPPARSVARSIGLLPAERRAPRVAIDAVPDVVIQIGRIEIRAGATSAPTASAVGRRPVAPRLSLDRYLEDRHGVAR